MKFLPIGLKVRNKKCVVIGGGRIGERKVRNLLLAGAEVFLVSPEVTPGLVELETAGRLSVARETPGLVELETAGRLSVARETPGLVELETAGRLSVARETPGLVELETAGRLSVAREMYRTEHLGGAFLAVVATDDQALNAQVVETAVSRGILVCDASSATRSEVIFGAIHMQEGLTVAVFTDGEDPSRARKARDRIAALVSDGEGDEAPSSG